MKKLLVLLLMGILVSSPAFAKRESSSEDATSVVLYGQTDTGTIVPVKVAADGSVGGGGGVGGITASGGINVPAGQEYQSGGYRVNDPSYVYASGTAATLTTSSALLTFGTTNPSLTMFQPGTYQISGGVQLKYNAATYAGNETAICKLRRVNNTAADLPLATRTIDLRIITTVTDNAGFLSIPTTYYTTENTNDSIQIFCVLSNAPAAGSVQAVSAEITIVRLY